MSLIEKTAVELLQMQSRGETTSEAITTAFLNTIQQVDSKIKAFMTVEADKALEQARAVDAKRKSGAPLGAFAGVPIAIKDVLCTKGTRTSCSSKILENFVPPYDATVVTRLREADAVIIGKTNMDEFAMGSSTENSAYFTTRNPWDLDRIPGGSSGGSAACVAACEVPVSLGTDTGGSIRQPAALCGIVGIKPTYGRVSRYGLIAFASSLDQVGPFTHDLMDNALLMEIISGRDPKDSTSIDTPVPKYTQSLNTPIKDLTIGVPKEFFGEGLDSEVEASVKAALKEYEKQGAKLKEVSLPHSKYAVAVYYLVATAEASSNLARFEGMHYGYRTPTKGDLVSTYSKTRGEGFGKEVQRRIMLGTYALSAEARSDYYLKALKVRRLIKNDFDVAFKECDVVIGPTSPCAAFKMGEKTENPLAMYLNDIYTISCNLAGIAGISIPCGFTKNKLPIGLQILAGPFEEEKMFRVARMYEAATDWHLKRAKV
ncbi:Asp-tRNA(Asn)/Glu-tRNA(Gln) amidotransferase subunit GatA [Telmatocola sphagniphila]|uniref:Glutamyl-tRNA(Gln) amidotransferase subunit A n=1 Tax=Telmatocola sphagniphila TaxID=1123043 RepID=A0A8E6B4W6_9BACT|nr:Asp-tRNA(Asn)/Glu-tRNA(Gln) amidotransferase subunit GatA [Telmatocola sphagniphila]QVL31816.1 Asp-tRNA(Asn)/Glu-tRNA(Gln) amidotransferase subunit GatA [Telmatocola sphagniphila]